MTAVFESWHIGDGNYPPLFRGQRVNLSFEVHAVEWNRVHSSQEESFVHLGGGEYEFTATVVKRYDARRITVLSSGDFRFYVTGVMAAGIGDRIRGRGDLLLDHYLWVEFLNEYSNPPDLFYQLAVERIRRVRIPESLISRHPRGKAFPTSLGREQYDATEAIEIETMEGQASDEAFYLLDLTDEGVSGRVARTFL